MRDFFMIREFRTVNDLNVLEIRTVIELDETDLTVVTVGPDPALNSNIFQLVKFHIGSVE